jgi:hypothetical protein
LVDYGCARDEVSLGFTIKIAKLTTARRAIAALSCVASTLAISVVSGASRS